MRAHTKSTNLHCVYLVQMSAELVSQPQLVCRKEYIYIQIHRVYKGLLKQIFITDCQHSCEQHYFLLNIKMISQM